MTRSPGSKKVAPSRPASEAKIPFERFSTVRSYLPTLAFSPDGEQIAYVTNTSGYFNLWRQPTSGGYPLQMTGFSENAVREAAWSPDGKHILFTADFHGNEFHQIFVIPAEGGTPKQLTDSADVQHFIGDLPWSPDSKSFFYSANDRSKTDRDVLVHELRSGKVKRVLEGESSYSPAAWSPDGKFITVVDVRSNVDTDVLLLEVKTSKTENLTPHEEDVLYTSGKWASDGSGFWLGSDEGRDFVGLAFFHIGPRKLEWIETPEWDVEGGSVSEDGRVLAWVVNKDGYSRIKVRNLKTGQPIALPEIPEGVTGLAGSVIRLSPDGKKLAFLLTRSDNPAEIFVVDLKKKKLNQITDGWIGRVDPKDLVRPKTIRFATHDGRKVPALLFKPKGSGKFPVVLSIHGGPESQERPGYMYAGLYQYLITRGIGVLAPNVRGSTGYGKTYQKLIHRDWGGDELKDFEAAVRYLHSLPWVDKDKVGVFGGSFGGFATLSCVSRLPDYWAAAVDIVGPSNLVTFAKAVPPTWRRFMAKWCGDPETEADFLMERSPITYADQIKTPLFVIQGANDPRVVQGESDQIVETLRARGVPVRYDVYEDEGHGFTKLTNQQKAMKDSALFLEEHLLS